MSNKDLPATELTKLEEVSTRVLCAMFMNPNGPALYSGDLVTHSKWFAGQLLGDKPDAEPEG